MPNAFELQACQTNLQDRQGMLTDNVKYISTNVHLTVNGKKALLVRKRFPSI